MIKLTRDRTEGAIHKNFRNDKRREFALELLKNQQVIERGDLEKHDFPSRWGDAKDQLVIETHGKCAYCEAPTTLVAYGDVEHYRPKSVYWWLAYCYENYLVSCQLCNQKFKKAKFPIQNQMLIAPAVTDLTDEELEALIDEFVPESLDDMRVTNFSELHIAERPFLINPYYDDPVDYYAWEVDDPLEEVRLIAKPDDLTTEPFVKAAIEDYGLNRPTLLKARYDLYNYYDLLCDLLDSATLDGVPELRQRTLDEVDSMKSDNQPFAGMIRYFEAIRNP